MTFAPTAFLASLKRSLWRAVTLFSLCGLFASPALAQPDPSAVWLVPIDTEITPATAQFVQSRVELANDAQPLALVFLINTPGGRVDAMQDIVDSILQRASVPTIAIVEDAFSAGALIAMSAEQLVMLPGSSIGAALTVTLNPLSPNGMSAADEKINSATRSQFRSVAEARGRDTRVAEAMVDQRIEIPGLSTNEELVTLTPEQAVDNGIADFQATSLRDALDQLGYQGVPIERLSPNAAERVATALTSPLIASALLAIGIIGILIEVFTPGFGIPGGLGVLALALFFGGSFIATPAGGIDLLLLTAGLGLIIVEILVIPGFGVAGVLGLVAIGFSVFRIFQADTGAVLGYTALFGGLLFAFSLWVLPNTRLANPFMLRTRLSTSGRGSGGSSGGSVREKTERLEQAKLVDDLGYLQGSIGVALSDLRPGGIARFDDLRADVVTEGDFIDVGTTVKVLRVEGNRIVVRTANEGNMPDSTTDTASVSTESVSTDKES